MAKKKTEEPKELDMKRFIFEVIVGSLLVGLMLFIGIYYGCALGQLPH